MRGSVRHWALNPAAVESLNKSDGGKRALHQLSSGAILRHLTGDQQPLPRAQDQLPLDADPYFAFIRSTMREMLTSVRS